MSEHKHILGRPRVMWFQKWFPLKRSLLIANLIASVRCIKKINKGAKLKLLSLNDQVTGSLINVIINLFIMKFPSSEL